MKSCLVIPARYHSTRLPGKVLADIGGKPMVQWVYEKALLVKNADRIVVATDDPLVMEAVVGFGAECLLTSKQHTTGTDRMGEVARMYQDCDVFINIQADEPMINPTCIEDMINYLNSHSECQILTLVMEIESEADLFDYNVVKVVRNKFNKCLYFSRQAIPAHRDLAYGKWLRSATYFRHIGVYGFTKAALEQVVTLPSSTLEVAESLEQLRWIENGFEIYSLLTDDFHFGVDTEKDLEKIRTILGTPLY